MSRYLKEKETRWGLHSIVTFDGVPFAVMQKWGLWLYKRSGTDRTASVTSMPSGDVELIPLRELIDEDSKTALMEEINGA